MKVSILKLMVCGTLMVMGSSAYAMKEEGNNNKSLKKFVEMAKKTKEKVEKVGKNTKKQVKEFGKNLKDSFKGSQDEDQGGEYVRFDPNTPNTLIRKDSKHPNGNIFPIDPIARNSTIKAQEQVEHINDLLKRDRETLKRYRSVSQSKIPTLEKRKRKKSEGSESSGNINNGPIKPLPQIPEMKRIESKPLPKLPLSKQEVNSGSQEDSQDNSFLNNLQNVRQGLKRTQSESKTPNKVGKSDLEKSLNNRRRHIEGHDSDSE